MNLKSNEKTLIFLFFTRKPNTVITETNSYRHVYLKPGLTPLKLCLTLQYWSSPNETHILIEKVGVLRRKTSFSDFTPRILSLKIKCKYVLLIWKILKADAFICFCLDKYVNNWWVVTAIMESYYPRMFWKMAETKHHLRLLRYKFQFENNVLLDNLADIETQIFIYFILGDI